MHIILKRFWRCFGQKQTSSRIGSASFAGDGASKRPLVVLMDELDMFVTSRQDVIYNLFHWPNLPRSNLVVIAVANTMDLPERTLQPKVASRLGMTRIDPVMYKGTPIGVELPAAVELEVTYAEPGVKGDTRTGATKPVTLETGLVVQVPLFVEQGDRIKVDTRTGEYLTRV